MGQATKLTWYDATVIWDGVATDSIVNGVIYMPDGSERKVVRRSHQSMFKAKNSPLFLGGTYYLLETPTGPARYDSFDDLMQKGLGLTRNG